MSSVWPSSFMLMAEHSMCQPGRPGPHGLSQDGSPGLAALPQGEVAGIALLVADLDARAGFQLLRIAVAQLAVIRVPGHVEIDVAAGRVGIALVDQPCIMSIMSPMCSVARGMWSMPVTLSFCRHSQIIGGHALGQFLDRGVLLRRLGR